MKLKDVLEEKQGYEPQRLVKIHFGPCSPRQLLMIRDHAFLKQQRALPVISDEHRCLLAQLGLDVANLKTTNFCQF